MKSIVYIRTSKRDQNPENQRLELEKYCKNNEIVYDIFEEQESTRKTRPIKQEILTKLRNKEYDTLIIWKLDRWGRSIQELIADLQELTDKGIKIISLKENIDYSSASGKLFANMLSAFADYEREIIRERTFLGLDRARSEGKQLGRRKGSKDKGKRRKGGYFMRYMPHKQSSSPKTAQNQVIK